MIPLRGISNPLGECRFLGILQREKHIGKHESEPQAVIPFDEVRESAAEKYGIF
mgnify:CR=1 FL=1